MIVKYIKTLDILLPRGRRRRRAPMLAQLARELDNGKASTLSGALSVIRRRGLVASADQQSLAVWSARLQALLRSPAPSARQASALLIGETARQCSAVDFARHREAWSTALLHLVQSPLSSSVSAAVRISAAEALLTMTDTSAPWPAERREMMVLVPRLAAAAMGMLGDPATQRDAVPLLVRLSHVAPHSMRSHREKLGDLLPEIAIGAPPPSAHAAAALLGRLPGCLPAASIEDAWIGTVQRVAGTLQRALGCALGSVARRPPLRYTLPELPLTVGALPLAVGADGDFAAWRGGLLRCVQRCALILHRCLCPPVEVSEPLPIPMEMMISLAQYVLSLDGMLEGDVAGTQALPLADLRLILPDVRPPSPHPYPPIPTIR